MSLRQQRTLSRTGLDPGQGPLPVMFTAESVAVPVPGLVIVTFPLPVRIQGIPPIRNQADELPLTCVIVDEFSCELAYTTSPVAGEVLRFPDWSPAIRGFNGEWVSGGSFLIGGGPDNSLPTVVFVTQVQATGGNIAVWSFSGAWEAESLLALQINTNIPTSFAQTSDNTVECEYGGDVNPGDSWGIGTWAPGTYSGADNTWIVPGNGIVV